MPAMLLTEQHLEFLSLTGDCTGSSESTHVKMPHFWKSHVLAHIQMLSIIMALNSMNPDQIAPNALYQSLSADEYKVECVCHL